VESGLREWPVVQRPAGGGDPAAPVADLGGRPELIERNGLAVLGGAGVRIRRGAVIERHGGERDGSGGVFTAVITTSKFWPLPVTMLRTSRLALFYVACIW
jgi:hypothetical protein